MLGTSANKLKYQSINDFHSPADYLEYLFGGVQGVTYRATIDPLYHQSFFRSSGLIKGRYMGVNNVYVAMNTFFRTKGLDEQQGRDVEHLKRLNTLYVDIDCYKVGLTKGEVLVRLEDEYFNSRIPEPTFVMDSGRGIYLVWKLRNEDKKALPRWTSIQQYLTDELQELGADQACTDGARILRVPFSRNPKSNSFVKIVAFNDLTYSLYEIAREYDIKPKKKNISVSGTGRKKYPYNHATERQRKYVKDIAKRLNMSEEAYPDFENFHETDNWIKLHKDISVTHSEGKGYCYKKGNVYSFSEFKSFKNILNSYCTDIRKLLTMRKGADCKRELALFLYRYFLREMNYDSDTALKKTLDFNASLSCPFDESYVSTVTASADRRIEKGIPYAYTKATIIRILDITKDELKELPFLSAGVRTDKERRRENNRKAYETRLAKEGKESKKDSILQRRATILELQEQGKTPVQIQEELHISRATYHRDVVALAVESVLSAVKEFLLEKAENTAETTEKAVETVSEAFKSMSKNNPLTELLSAIKKSAGFRLSHFFSTPFIEKYSVAVPHSPIFSTGVYKILNWITKRHNYTSGDTDGDNSN